MRWRRSSRSTEPESVEVAIDGDWVFVRNAGDPGGPVMRVTLAEWREFLASARAGEFDLNDD